MLSQNVEFTDSDDVTVVNCYIHGFITLHPILKAIMDTRQFQRLRKLKQLGPTSFVFPCADHCRFEHSLGTCYLAGELVNRLRNKQPDLEIDDRDQLCVMIAALCHDLGHGPFSHLWQEFVHKCGKEFSDQGLKEWRHENQSVKMLEHLLADPENKMVKDLFKKHKLDDDQVTFIGELICGPPYKSYKSRGPEKRFLYQIVANSDSGVDVDKMDYFARDSYNLNIKSSFDHKRLLKFARVMKNDDGENEITFRDKERANVKEMFHNRMLLHRKAYQHRTKVSIDLMLIDLFMSANKHLSLPGGEDGLQTYRMSDAHRNPWAYEKLNDSVLDLINCSTKLELKEAQGLLKRIEKRRLYTFIGELTCVEPDRLGKNIIDNVIDNIKNEESKKKAKLLLKKKKLEIATSVLSYGGKNKMKSPLSQVAFHDKQNERISDRKWPPQSFMQPDETVGKNKSFVLELRAAFEKYRESVADLLVPTDDDLPLTPWKHMLNGSAPSADQQQPPAAKKLKFDGNYE